LLISNAISFGVVANTELKNYFDMIVNEGTMILLPLTDISWTLNNAGGLLERTEKL